jgi:GxxExxY protein
MSDLILPDESYKITGAVYEVYNNLGQGFLESVYQEALSIEFDERGIPYQELWGIEIFYKGCKLKKKFTADFLCYDKIIIELKAVEFLAQVHEAQLLNYLKSTNKTLGILINFGGSPLEIKRLAYTQKKRPTVNFRQSR